jgi:hypothetical protein
MTDNTGMSRSNQNVVAANLTSGSETAVWKSQGATCHGKVIVELSPTEIKEGLSYVQLSRVTTTEN